MHTQTTIERLWPLVRDQIGAPDDPPFDIGGTGLVWDLGYDVDDLAELSMAIAGEFGVALELENHELNRVDSIAREIDRALDLVAAESS